MQTERKGMEWREGDVAGTAAGECCFEELVADAGNLWLLGDCADLLWWDAVVYNYYNGM